MHVIHGYKHVPQDLRGASVALGNFDGVHRGHRALIDAARKQALAMKRPAGVLVFDPHPREFFQPDETHFRLTSLPRKLRLFEQAHLDVVFVEPFTAELAALPADTFIERVLVAGLGISHVVIGYDFYFGHKRGGNPELMMRSGEAMGFGVTVVPPVAEDGEAFSSSEVRLHLAQGNVKGAAHMLGEPWRAEGEIVHGARRGTGLGFPTANLALPKGTTLGHGIYAVRARLGGQTYDGAAYLGTRPTFDHGKPVLEVYLFRFAGDIYGRSMEVEFVDFIRPDRKFASSDELISQMQQDVEDVERALAPQAR